MTHTHIIVYSHGFGVEKDDRGLLTDISIALPGMQHILFDYNQIDRGKNELTAAPLDSQAKKLNEVIDRSRMEHPDAVIDVVAHSQGCLAAALAMPDGVRKIIMTAPPPDADIEDKVKRWRVRYGTSFTTTGTSYLARKDGSTTIVPPEYWTSIQGLDAQELYNSLAKICDVIVITATEDEVLGGVAFDKLAPEIRIAKMATGHNFEGESRQQLVNIIREELES